MIYRCTFALTAALILTSCGPDDDLLWSELGYQDSPITNGSSHNGHPSVGYMMVPKGVSMGLCTGTLVGSRTVLTAAHCIPPGEKITFVLHGYLYNISQKTIQNPGWNSSSLANDIGLVILEKAPPNATPSIISKVAPYQGQKIQLVGYGLTSSYNKDSSGVKRTAYNYVRKVYSTRFSYQGSGGGIGNTCSGDSGGPAFATVNGREEIVGVTSAGTEPCGGLSFDTRVDSFYSWLMTNSGGDLYTKPDTENPKVKITSPASGTKLIGAFTVKATASDDTGVTKVQVHVDGKYKTQKTSAPWEFSLNLPAGTHTVKAVAVDKKNKQGHDQITVQVINPLGFGRQCGSNKHCQSGMCARDPKTGLKYCTQKCLPGGDPCGYGASCVPAGTNVYVCGPPTEALPEEGDVEGSCSAGAVSSLPSGAALMLLLLLAVRRRA